jgi:hypothetical protein
MMDIEGLVEDFVGFVAKEIEVAEGGLALDRVLESIVVEELALVEAVLVVY